MDIEQALGASYPLGKMQVLINIAAGLAYMQLDFIVLSSVFIAEIPPHHCAIAPGYTANDTIPVDEDGDYVRCEEYVNLSVSKEKQPCSEGWDYDTKLYGASITSEWDLVCNKDYLSDLSQILPESVRWLISQNKIEKAEETMQYIAKFNRTKDFPSPFFTVKEEIASTKGVKTNVVQEADKKKKAGRLTLLFKPPTLIVTVILGWFMFTHTTVYFGFALTTGCLAGDLYLNFFLSSVVELPSRTIPLFILRRTGNLRPLLACFFASGIIMVGIIVIESNNGEPKWLLTTLSLLGKLLVTFTFPSVSLLITELFPTTMRNSGTGNVRLFGSIGSLSSPLLLYMVR
ncbi:Solute carrier family 22 member 15 [Holothuria leucospilota]|uniref:Solute carrier family 22 member 15 n=1 Tax=Holothuria leucospilota TaxID=206669 RepID=A0A9Q1BS71_HOLLE|nr:Solute carrier family 22 member 15 [Holothuria leucospilota]